MRSPCDKHPHEKQCRILVVDGVAEFRMLIKMIVAKDRRCIVIAEASDGPQAVQAAVETEPDVIILDIGTAPMDGITALPELQAGTPAAKVILYTSHPLQPSVARALDVFEVVPKDADASQLLGAIHRAIGADRTPLELAATR